MNRYVLTLLILAGGALVLAACSRHETVPGTTMTPAQVSAVRAASAAQAAKMASAAAPLGTAGASMHTEPAAVGTASLPNLSYMALLYPLNSTTTGSHATGKAQFAENGDELTIRVNVTGAAPGMAHWQHIHGFVSGEDAQCPTSTADANGDGYVDLIETDAVSGTTMVPLNGDPVAMDISAATYPQASADGSYMYQVTVSMDGLQSAFGQKFDGQQLDLTKRVIYIHGVPATTMLPPSVSSLPGVAAQTTLPIACGEITEVMQTAAPMPGS